MIKGQGVHVGVLGLGLIGGSLALRLADSGVPVVGWDPDESTRVAARAAGVKVVHERADLVLGAGIIVVAGPLVAIPEVCQWLGSVISPEVTVMDVGSVKGPVRREMRAAGLERQFVGAHPMAGAETSGFSAARPDVLDSAMWAVSGDDAADPRRVLEVMRLITGPARGRVVVVDDATHDAVVALVSHVPHVFAHELLGYAAEHHLGGLAKLLAAGSFRDGTRVARLNPQRNAAMVWHNRHEVAHLLDDMIDELVAFRQHLLLSEQSVEFAEFFDRSQQWSRGDSARKVVNSDAGGSERSADTPRHLVMPLDQFVPQLREAGLNGSWVREVNWSNRSLSHSENAEPDVKEVEVWVCQ